jgi:predicted nucleotidyltransferase
VEHLAEQLESIPGVVAVTLGGSRARGEAGPDSDWDFGLYYRGSIDTDAIRAFGFAGEVFEPWAWGRLPNGGAWLEIDGQRVDLIYRDLDVVEHWVREAEAGRFEIWREVGYTAGAPTYTFMAELATNKTLTGKLPIPAFPEALRATAPPIWLNLARGALKFASHHARNHDPVPEQANLAVAVLQLAQAKCAKEGEWVTNEKRLVERAALSHLSPLSYLSPLSHEAVEAAVASEG